jgi:hypothetical protein
VHRQPPKSSPEAQNQVRTPDALTRLRGFRVFPQRARTLEGDLDRTMKSLRQVTHTEQAAIEAWDTVVPDQLRDDSDAVGMDRGKLIVTIPSAAHRYKADNWLRSGGLRELQSLARVPIRSVQMKIVRKHADPTQASKRIDQ